jgi:hypothetical protein
MDRGVERFCLIAVNVHLLFLSIHDLNKHDCHVSIEVFFRTVRILKSNGQIFPAVSFFHLRQGGHAAFPFQNF